MLKRSAIVVLILMCAAVDGRAQEPKPAAAAKATTPAKAAQAPKPAAGTKLATTPAPAAVASEPAMPVNIKIEVTITDQTGANPGSKKTVSMIVGDRQRNSIRSSASVAVPMRPPSGSQVPVPTSFNYRNVTINVDARPAIVVKEPNKISMEFGLEYLPKSAGGAEELEPGMSTLNERLGLVLDSGKPLIVSQAADPTSDRRITVEVTATILK